MKFNLLMATAGVAFASLAGQAGAAVLNLTYPGSPSGTINGATYTLVDPSEPAGTGVFDTFLRVQAGGNESIEKGYNTDGTVEFQTKVDPHTHSITVGDLEEVGGKFVFRVDTNEPGGGQASITIERLQLFLTSDASLTGYNTATNSFGASATKIYDMDDPTDNSVAFLDLNAGSGRHDMEIAFDKSIFGGDLTKHVVLFAEFGNFGGGFEEFSYKARVKCTGPDCDDGDLNIVPVPASLPLLAGGLVLAGFVARRKSRKA